MLEIRGKLLQTLKVFNVVHRGVLARYDVMSDVDVRGLFRFLTSTMSVNTKDLCECDREIMC